MSFPTQPVYVHQGSWNATSRKHRAMEWMERYTREAIEGRQFNDPSTRATWMTDDHTFGKSTGEVCLGGDATWSSIGQAVYAPFKEHLHDPSYFVVTDRGNGTWEMFGLATLFWNLQIPGQGSAIKDAYGKTWDGAIPSAFKFRYVTEQDGGIKIAKTEIFSDPTAAIVAMLKGGMLKPEDLMK